jgi:hypothetical protein
VVEHGTHYRHCHVFLGNTNTRSLELVIRLEMSQEGNLSHAYGLRSIPVGLALGYPGADTRHC